jgi:hypothetical protein
MLASSGIHDTNKRRISLIEEHVGALAMFWVIFTFLTYPVSLRPGSLVLGRPFEDAFESIWYLHWYKQAIFDLGISPLFQPDIFYPGGWDLRFAILPPLYPAFLSPLTALVGPIVAYNLSLMGSCVLAAYGVFLMTRALGAGTMGSILAGVTYAFYPNREVYLGGFLNLLLGSMWLPWMIYGLVQANRNPQIRLRWMVFSGLTYGFSIAGAWQFVFIGTTVWLIFGAVSLWPVIRSAWRTWIWPIAAAFLASFCIAGPLLLNAMDVRQQMGTGVEFSFENVDASSVSIERFLIPSALNPLMWNLARETFPLTNGEDGVASFGYIPLLLGLLSVWRRRQSVYVNGLLVLVVIGVVLMMGTTVHWWGRSLHIPMPALILYRFVPPFHLFHHFGRWGLVASLGIAALAGLGLTEITRRSSSWKRIIVGIGCLLCLLLEFNLQPLPAVTSIEQMQRSVDDWLAAQPERSVIIEYPLAYTMHGQSLYYTITHGQKIVHGYSSILPAGFPELLQELNRWPDDAAIDLLEDIGVRYVLVHSFAGDNFEEESLPVLLSIERLRLIGRFDTSVGPVRNTYLFELVENAVLLDEAETD